MTAQVGSTVLVVAIVVVWVVVLLPMFLRGHDKRNELGSVERFAGAMHVLARRRRVGRYDLRPSEERAAVIGRAFGARSAPVAVQQPSAPMRYAASEPVRPTAPPPTARPGRRAARVAARRRGLAALTAVFVITLLLAVVVGGPMWAVFGLSSVLVLAGLAQLRAMAVADAYVAAPRRPVERSAADVVPAVVAAVVSAALPVAAPARRRPSPGPGEDLPAAVGYETYTPVARGAGKQIVFDAVSETPVVEKPRVRTVAASGRRVSAGVPDDFYERPQSPPAPEQVRRSRPLLDEVDTDPETLTSGLDALDGILGRASGE